MARKRMFSLEVVDTDKFLDMPTSSQALYFHLGMRADDEGFVSSPRRIMKTINCNDDDLKILITKGYLIPFNSGIVVLTHWKINNYLQNDRVKKTVYTDEKSTLRIGKNKSYFLNGYKKDTKCIQSVSIDKNRLDKNRLEENRIDKNSKEKKPKKTKRNLKQIIESYTTNPELRKALNDFVEMRNRNRKFLTPKALELCLKKLDELAIDDFIKIDIVNQSILHSWLTFYELKNNSNSNGQNNNDFAF